MVLTDHRLCAGDSAVSERPVPFRRTGPRLLPTERGVFAAHTPARVIRLSNPVNGSSRTLGLLCGVPTTLLKELINPYFKDDASRPESEGQYIFKTCPSGKLRPLSLARETVGRKGEEGTCSNHHLSRCPGALLEGDRHRRTSVEKPAISLPHSSQGPVADPLLACHPGTECPGVDLEGRGPGRPGGRPSAAAPCWLPLVRPAGLNLRGDSEVAGTCWGPGLPLSPQRPTLRCLRAAGIAPGNAVMPRVPGAIR